MKLTRCTLVLGAIASPLAAQAQTPAWPPANIRIVERFGNAMAETLREERIAKQLIETQQVSLTLGGPEVERKFLADQMRVWGKVVKDNDIKADQN